MPIYHVSASYSTTADDPREAAELFFAATRNPASIFLEVFPDGEAKGAIAEFDGAELVQIALDSEAPAQPKFAVILTRDVTESAVVTVRATTPEEAQAAAQKLATHRLPWKVDDGNEWNAPYITGTEAR